MADKYISKYKVAVASTKGESVDQHYGRAEKFYIYTVDDEEGYDFLEERKVQPVCLGGKHNKSEMENSVSKISDCRYVVASRIGAGAISSIAALGITAMELPGSIDDAILKIWKYNRIQGLFNKIN
ncbi:MAG: dinitrogenase iron-molybdenum cofactor biosynthesis protein [Treponema sp.]|nr:dinitrogenase iron-molybdenum cofactor biosynthesis protein [Treponema sp.]